MTGSDSAAGTPPAPPSRRYGLVHTVAGLDGDFDARLRRTAPAAEAIHVVDPWLLDRAIAAGIEAEHDVRLRRYVTVLADAGVSAVLVTCSSIGEVTDRVAAEAPVPVLRVDRPMVQAAAGRAPRHRAITVLATLASTLGPTGRLVSTVCPSNVPTEARVVEGAIAARDAGNADRFHGLIREAVEEALAAGHLVVLAQASMAAALADTAAGDDDRVLTSPHLAIGALVTAS